MWLLTDEEQCDLLQEMPGGLPDVVDYRRAIASAQLRKVAYLLTEMCVEEIPLANWNALLDESGLGHYED